MTINQHKRSLNEAHGGGGSFVSGFGCAITRYEWYHNGLDFVQCLLGRAMSGKYLKTCLEITSGLDHQHSVSEGGGTGEEPPG